MRIRAMINSANCLIYCPTRLTCPTRPSGRSILHSHYSSLITNQRQNLLFAVAQCTVERRSRGILTRAAAIKIFASIIINAKMI